MGFLSCFEHESVRMCTVQSQGFCFLFSDFADMLHFANGRHCFFVLCYDLPLCVSEYI